MCLTQAKPFESHFMSTVTLQKVDSEYVLRLPSDLVERLGLTAGSVLEIRSEQQCLVLESAKADVAEVLAIHERLMDEYHEAFKKLAAY
jgi:antitoxin component of MazEF toxin-antitoxin module